MLIIIECLNCGKPKEVDVREHSKTARKGKNVGRFCGPVCAGKWVSTHHVKATPNTSCEFCKIPLYRNGYRSRRWKVFCSRACKGKGGVHGFLPTRLKISCGFCKKDFEVAPSNSWRRYCSRKCTGQQERLIQKKTLSPFKTTNTKRFYSSVAWKELRIRAFERDNYTCVDCGQRGGKLEANHINPRCLAPEDALNILNIETLCKPCHKKKKSVVTEGLRNLKRT